MRTTSLQPPFPRDLGSWLANFRHRRRDARGHPFSPELLGREIGVSGATIRRWEAGRLRPNINDGPNLAAAYNLTLHQYVFLTRALRSQPPPFEVNGERFKEEARGILSLGYPGYMLDSLYYVRAWNSYLPSVLKRPRNLHEDLHLIEYVLQSDDDGPQVDSELRQRIRRITRNFWSHSADYCGSASYKSTIARLATNDIFREEWCRLAFLQEDEDGPIGLPTSPWRSDIGTFRVVPYNVLIPPLYQICEFVPLDETARATLEGVQSSGPADIHFDNQIHWAQTPETDDLVVLAGG